jgi:hypothetical protein
MICFSRSAEGTENYEYLNAKPNPAMTDASNTVVILGTGATIGSGYTRCGKNLPGDQGFFCNPHVQSLLKEEKYPALYLMLGTFRNVYGDNLANVSLEAVWTFLEFSAKDIFEPLTDLTWERQRWLDIIRKPESRTDDEHCLCQHYREDHTITQQTEIDLHLLAGWDLRKLLCRVYGETAAPVERNAYESLISKYGLPKDSTTTFISLNYDTILEKELTRAGVPWHYLHVQTTVHRDKASVLSSNLTVRSIGYSRETNLPSASLRTIALNLLRTNRLK